VADEDEEALRKVDAEQGRVVGEPIPLGDFPFDIEVGRDGLFVLCNDSVVQVDIASGRVTGRVPLEGDVDDIAVGEGFLWMADGNANTLTRVPLS
jgi:hypothetical protein